MLAFSMGFSLWVFSFLAVRADTTTSDSSWFAVMGLACCIAYVFWGIGWGLSRVADMLYSAL